MGGEPLCSQNIFLTKMVIEEVKRIYPNKEIYVWTGYTLKDLKDKQNIHLKYILDNINCLIDGKYIEEERDITLPLRGSRN